MKSLGGDIPVQMLDIFKLYQVQKIIFKLY